MSGALTGTGAVMWFFVAAIVGLFLFVVATAWVDARASDDEIIRQIERGELGRVVPEPSAVELLRRAS